MQLDVEFDREEDGRWIAEIVTLPGAMAYGRTRMEALAAAKALALRILAAELEHGELPRLRGAALAEKMPDPQI